MRNTINLQAIVRSNAAAGHSGQKSTVKRSEMRLSKIALYSASFEFFVVFVLPERCVKNRMIVLAAFVADSNPEIYNRISSISVLSNRGPETSLELSSRRKAEACIRDFWMSRASRRTPWAEVWTSWRRRAETVRMERPSRRRN